MVVNVNSEIFTGPFTKLDAMNHGFGTNTFLPGDVGFVWFGACANGEDELVTVYFESSSRLLVTWE